MMPLLSPKCIPRVSVDINHLRVQYFSFLVFMFVSRCRRVVGRVGRRRLAPPRSARPCSTRVSRASRRRSAATPRARRLRRRRRGARRRRRRRSSAAFFFLLASELAAAEFPDCYDVSLFHSSPAPTGQARLNSNGSGPNPYERHSNMFSGCVRYWEPALWQLAARNTLAILAQSALQQIAAVHLAQATEQASTSQHSQQSQRLRPDQLGPSLKA